MAAKKELKDPVTLFAKVEEKDKERLRKIAHDERRSLASVTREALDLYLEKREGSEG